MLLLSKISTVVCFLMKDGTWTRFGTKYFCTIFAPSVYLQTFKSYLKENLPKAGTLLKFDI